MTMTDRSTGGNRFIPHNAHWTDLVNAIDAGVRDLVSYARDTGRTFDPGAVTIDTRRIKDGRISVSVTGDLTTDHTTDQGPRQDAGAEEERP